MIVREVIEELLNRAAVVSSNPGACGNGFHRHQNTRIRDKNEILKTRNRYKDKYIQCKFKDANIFYISNVTFKAGYNLGKYLKTVVCVSISFDGPI